MALKTLGTNANNSLSALVYASGTEATADMATLQQGIKNDKINGFPTFPGAFGTNGLLFVPNRGQLLVLPGDYVAWDSVTGWPILISAAAIGAGGTLWTHN